MPARPEGDIQIFRSSANFLSFPPAILPPRVLAVSTVLNVDMHDNCSQSTVFKLGESGDEKGSPLARVVTLADGGFDHRASDEVRVAREMDARAWRKMDYAVLPVVTMIFFLSFLVRALRR